MFHKPEAKAAMKQYMRGVITWEELRNKLHDIDVQYIVDDNKFNDLQEHYNDMPS